MEQGLSKKVLCLMAVSACVVVANNYYNQPLLGDISRELNITESKANQVATITILGYALGLFLIVPLGDMLKKKKLIIADFVLIIASLLCFASSSNIEIMLLSRLSYWAEFGSSSNDGTISCATICSCTSQ